MSGDPNYEALLNLLPTLRKWADATGEITLTDEEAACIRSLGFSDAKAGCYKLPPFPYELVADTMFEYLSMGWGSRQAWSNPDRAAAPPATPQAQPKTRTPLQQSMAVERVPLLLASRVELETPLLSLLMDKPTLVARPRLEPEVRDHPRPTPPASEGPSDAEQAREAGEALKAEVGLVARKILKAVHKEGGRLAKRRAHQRLSRHKGIFKDSLAELVARGLVVVEGKMIVELSRVMQDGSDTRRASPENRALR